MQLSISSTIFHNHLNGSSSSMTSPKLYMALAKLTRCLWPPLKLMPRSPISVISPSTIKLKSRSNAHTLITFLYFFSSNGNPNMILSRKFMLSSHASCGTYAMDPLTSQSPSSCRIWRSSAASNDDLPDPTSPTIAKILPRCAVKLSRFSDGASGSELELHVNVAFLFFF
jgi:hypothetical protein